MDQREPVFHWKICLRAWKYRNNIVSTVEKNAIPDSLIINFDQTPLKMVQCGNNTPAKKNRKVVTIVGADDKRSITATFSITLLGQFLPIQLIYGGKTLQNLPRYQFPRIFSLSVNEKHFSNTSTNVSANMTRF